MIAYCKHLFDESTDGYIQIAKFKDGKIDKIKNTDIDYLKEIGTVERIV